MITLLVTDQNLNVIGDPLDGWTNLDVTRRFNEPASGTVDLPASLEVMSILQPGNRLVVMRDGAVWTAGPMEIPQEIEVGYGGGDSSGGQAPPGDISINFTDDLGRIAGHFTWPNPAVAWASQPANTWRTINATGGETIIRTLVNENCGPGALTARRIPRLILGPLSGAGTTTLVNTRFEGVLEACRRVAIDGGGIGFRTRQDGRDIVFEVYQPRDLSRTARFSFGLGNLRYLRAKLSAPTVTHALVAGTEDEGATTRAFVEVADTAAASTWYRVEKFVDGSATDDTAGELTQAGRDELAGGAAPVELATVTVDIPDSDEGPGQIAGRDFDLGDRVSVQLPNGEQVTDLVRSMHLQATPTGGEQVTTLVGSPEATSDPQMVRLVRDLSRRIGRITAR
ncbi:siphovirus ReqiPepy6 Gp37-like family protein [Actinomadura sp. NPDC049382]|uniref:siphovirus ReqiPepy6 Gp37-like family protein n=1 Tax=Actinomadura sp. NPDC049382 TaxID=3158220 RepID=UPI003435E867